MFEKHFTKDSCTLIQKVAQYIEENQIQYIVPKIDLIDKVLKCVIPNNTVNDFSKIVQVNESGIYKNYFISDNIVKESTKLKQHYTFKIDNIELNVYRNLEMVNMNRLMKIYYIISYLAGTNKKVIVNFYLIKYKKCLNSFDNYIGPKHVNSGSTDRVTINIWRREELYKVFIHELIHFFEADIDDLNNELGKRIKSSFNIDDSSNVLPNEAYTEVLANILNCIIISCELYVEYHNICKMVEFLLKCEIFFSLYQTAKIIKFFKFSSMTEFLQKNHYKKIVQKSSIFSYYIIKSALLYNLNGFLSFINNDIVFISDINMFYKLIYDSLHCAEYVLEIDKMCKMFKFNDRTMRMTVSELI